MAGIEADIQGTANSSNNSFTNRSAPTPHTNFWVYQGSVNSNLSYLGTARGCIGYLPIQNIMLFATGGLAYGGVNLNTNIVQAGLQLNPAYNFTYPGYFTGYGSNSTDQVGWTAGGGIEWLFMPNLSAKLEYNYYDFGSLTQNFLAARFTSDPPSPVYFLEKYQGNNRFKGNIVRAGVNYHFNLASVPAVAKF